MIFEVVPNDGRRSEYLDLAAALRPALDAIDGFVSIERFESLTEPGKILSLSFWRDETAVRVWRQHEEHRRTQRLGRSGVFHEYRLRVAEVVRDYGMHVRGDVPGDSCVYHGA